MEADWSYVATGQGCLETPEARRGKEGSASGASREWLHWGFEFGFPASRTQEWENKFVVLSHEVCYSSPRKPIQYPFLISPSPGAPILYLSRFIIVLIIPVHY